MQLFPQNKTDFWYTARQLKHIVVIAVKKKNSLALNITLLIISKVAILSVLSLLVHVLVGAQPQVLGGAILVGTLLHAWSIFGMPSY